MSESKEIYEGAQPVYAEVILRSKSGIRLMDPNALLSKVPLDQYKADDATLCRALRQFPDWGFNVIAHSPFGLSIIGPKELYREYFKTEIMYRTIKVEEYEIGDDKEFYMTEPPILPNALSSEIETVIIPSPVRLHSFPIDLPDGIIGQIGADVFHKKTYYGKGVTMAMVDSGLDEKHEYYRKNVYDINVIGYKPGQDNKGHGTGMAANLLAVAPECDFNLFKIDPRSANLPAKAAFDLAADYLGVKVISNSWGCKADPQTIALIDLSIRYAVEKKRITVVFSCGNGALPEFPGCHPKVVSVGGVNPTGKWLIASDYASSGTNPALPSRVCPDVCGLCGPAPGGVLIRMPTPKGSTIDSLWSNYDHTSNNDGWFVGSGTSAAAAQVAGGVALILSKNSTLLPDDIKTILMNSATTIYLTDPQTGQQTNNPDPATGKGLINLAAAYPMV